MPPPSSASPDSELKARIQELASRMGELAQVVHAQREHYRRTGEAAEKLGHTLNESRERMHRELRDLLVALHFTQNEIVSHKRREAADQQRASSLQRQLDRERISDLRWQKSQQRQRRRDRISDQRFQQSQAQRAAGFGGGAGKSVIRRMSEALPGYQNAKVSPVLAAPAAKAAQAVKPPAGGAASPLSPASTINYVRKAAEETFGHSGTPLATGKLSGPGSRDRLSPHLLNAVAERQRKLIDEIAGPAASPDSASRGGVTGVRHGRKVPPSWKILGGPNAKPPESPMRVRDLPPLGKLLPVAQQLPTARHAPPALAKPRLPVAQPPSTWTRAASSAALVFNKLGKAAGSALTGFSGLGGAASVALPALGALTAGVMLASTAAVAWANVLGGIIQAASPNLWRTLTGSFELLAAKIGLAATPLIIQFIAKVQQLVDRWDKLDDSTKSLIASFLFLEPIIKGFADAIRQPGKAVGNLLSGPKAGESAVDFALGKAKSMFQLGESVLNPAGSVARNIAGRVGQAGLRAARGEKQQDGPGPKLKYLDLNTSQARISSVESVWENMALGFLQDNDFQRELVKIAGQILGQMEKSGSGSAEKSSAAGFSPGTGRGK